MAVPRILGCVQKLVARFCHDRKANIAVNFGIAVIPILGMVGAATDYSLAARVKAKLSSAADTAVVAAVSLNSAGWTQAMAMTSNGTVSNGVTEANNIFMGNASTMAANYTNLQVISLTVTKTGATLTATLQWSANVPVTFLAVLGWSQMTVTETSTASSTMPLYLDFYLTLDVSGSMGLPSTTSEASRMQSINPDNWVQYPTGCTLACHFAPQKSACVDPPVTPPAAPPSNPPTNSSYTQQYNTNGYCMGYAYSRVSQSGLSSLLNMASTKTVPKQVPGFPVSMISGLPGSLNTDPTWGLPAVANCPTAGTDACIQLRLDAVGYAVNQLFAYANTKAIIANQFRVGLYPFITTLYSYFPLTSSINGSSTNSTTINYAAANLATLLDTNMNSNLGSGGTHIDVALNSLNTNVITSVGDGTASNNTLPYVFLVTDGAQDPQSKGVPNGGWSGSNHATVLNNSAEVSYPNACTQLKNRGIKIAVLYIPYVPISPVNSSFANDEDDAANNNIPNIPPSLQWCASPPDAAGSYFYTANTPQDIQNALQAMFNHAIATAHLTQ